MVKDYYKILEIEENFTEDNLKKNIENYLRSIIQTLILLVMINLRK